jgi:hypothetical protein
MKNIMRIIVDPRIRSRSMPFRVAAVTGRAVVVVEIDQQPTSALM